MGKNTASDIEFEKNRQDILRMAQQANFNKIINNSTSPDDDLLVSGDRKAIWEYEIIEYRKKKNREKFMVFGASCGVISLIISLLNILNQTLHFIK